ncbi:hypothetical protein LCGC14_2484040 [marine sediment metagenome]|uniref:Uncharacterized protein n=1 Tax=marine sediment metagenome TaxID=412755 RepID=A0A0F9DIM9_9ZZZZ
MEIRIQRHDDHIETYGRITKITPEYSVKDEVLSLIMERHIEVGVLREFTAVHLGKFESIEIRRDICEVIG